MPKLCEMPPKTKTQLKEELEQARRELAEAKARIETEAAEASSAIEERAREAKRELTKELQSTRRERDEVKRDLTEATEELATAQEKIRELELRLEEERTAPGAGATPSSEVGVVLVGELEEARDEALEALDRTQWEMERLKREHELQLLQVKESLREELEKKYERDLKTRDELIELMRGKKQRDVVSEVRGAGAQSSGGGSPEPESLGESTWGAGNRLKLPTLPKFTGEDRDDVDSLRRWIAKLEKHAELQKWTDREKLVQFELHLAGRAERVYEVLPSTSKVSFKVATGALQKRLNPVEREALVSAQLMRRKQQTGKSVDEFAQDLENLFDRSYGRRAGMDEGSKEMLKRDFFVQGLLLKWQEKVLPSAKTFSNALHQARAAEQQERQLIKLHQSGGIVKAGTNSKSSASDKAASGSACQSGERPESSASSTSGRGRLPGGCFECGSHSHRWRDCPKLKPPRKTPGKRDEVKRDLTEATEELATAQEKIRELELRLEEERTAPGAGATPSSEVGVVLVGELEEARDEALEALDRTQWEMERLKREHELQLLQVKESLREELEKKYERDLKTRDELIELMRGKKQRDVVSEVRGAGAQSSGGGSPEPESLGESTWGAGNRLKLPTLPKFTGEDRDDVDSLRRWIAKLEKHAELQKWTDREKLVQFELHLAGRAERVYEVLPSTSKVSFKVATGALQKRLNPVEREALVSAQLMQRKQQTGKSVDEFAQDLENLFDRSYGRRAGMDEGSKEMLKRDFFVQGLLLKWQEKVLPSAKTFSNALHQARAAEQQERQLIKLHQSGGIVKAGTNSKSSASDKAASGSACQSGERPESSASSTSGRGRLPGGCFECGSHSHRWRDCPKLKPPRKTPGKRSVPKATNSAINTSQETLGDKCERLQKTRIDAEFVRLSQSYETVGEVDHVAGAVGPLYFGTVSIVGEAVEAMVDTGS